MPKARQSQEWKIWQTVALSIAMLPLMGNTVEIFAARNYGWNLDIFTNSMVLAGSMFGALLMMSLRMLSDWRNSSLDLRLHGPMAVLILATACMEVFAMQAIVNGTETNTYAVFFFLGVLSTSLFLMVLAPSEPKA